MPVIGGLSVGFNEFGSLYEDGNLTGTVKKEGPYS